MRSFFAMACAAIFTASAYSQIVVSPSPASQINAPQASASQTNAQPGALLPARDAAACLTDPCN